MSDKRKKIGIVTLPGRYNYGNRLQNYAVDHMFSDLGLRPTTLRNETLGLLRGIRKLSYVIRGKATAPEEGMSDARLAAFDRFDSRIDIESVHHLHGLKKCFDYFAVGSDQVWNPHYNRFRTNWYYLDFAMPSQRIALAPSIGIESLANEQAKRVAKGVAGFHRLSVREKRGAELIKECSGRDAKVICDPTLTLSAEEWRAVADGRCTPSEPYVFTYLLGGVGAEASDVLEKVTDHGRLPVVPLSDRQKPNEPDAGPAEFISLIDHAVHVVTDSFHAAVFSSILHTPLTIVHREGGASMFSRLEQLSEMLGIEDKVYGSPSYDLAKAGDYKGVDEAIGREHERFMDYLEGCLNG